jgi:hypothetical protein
MFDKDVTGVLTDGNQWWFFQLGKDGVFRRGDEETIYEGTNSRKDHIKKVGQLLAGLVQE